MKSTQVCQNPATERLVVSGRLIRIARCPSEAFEPLEEPETLVEQLRSREVPPDLFCFTQRVSETKPRFSYFSIPDPVAVLEIETYDKWWKTTVNDKTRNMVRKAGKKGVSIGVSDYSDELISGIKEIYDECPIRQGKKSRHFGKSFETIKREHGTFLDRSEFFAARHNDRLVGFAKVVFQRDYASIMNLIALISERDKAPTNALLASIVARCAEKEIGLLHYGVWSRRGFGDFKLHHGFQCRYLPRYYVPLTRRGTFALQLGLHQPLRERLPERYLDWLATLRTRWYAWRYPMK